MNFLREKVSGSRKRYLKDGFNLDLTYIDKNIIASSLPCCDISKLYRNNIKNVNKFLTKYHKNHHLIINISNIIINKSKVWNDMNIYNFNWENHKPPKFDILVNIIKICSEYLKKDEKNIVFIHCLSGKGRTGTAIICLLIYLKKIDSLSEGIKLYKKLRGVTVNHPSQVRYIDYFYKLINSEYIRNLYFRKKFKSYRIKSIEIFSTSTLKLKFKIFMNNKMIEKFRINMKEFYNKQTSSYILDFKKVLEINDDFHIEVYSYNFLKKKLLCFFHLNTNFFEEKHHEIKLNPQQLDPFKKIKNINLVLN